MPTNKELEEKIKELEEKIKELQEKNKLDTPPTCLYCDRPASKNIWWVEGDTINGRFWNLCDCCFEEENAEE